LVFAINESSAAFHIYAPLAKVAAHTARTQTSLRPRMRYDGAENWFTQWMRERGVDVIFVESHLKSELWRLSKSAPSFLSSLPGVFLRLEQLLLGSSLNANDPVLYTDCDVMFRRDVAIELKDAVCRYFAVTGESKLDDYRDINTGVMLMNLDKVREVVP
jgi:hypothetical protein